MKRKKGTGFVFLFSLCLAFVPGELLSPHRDKQTVPWPRIEGAWRILWRYPFEFLQAARFNNIRIVDGDNGVGWAGQDTGAWLNAAYADLPPRGGTIYYAPRTDGLCASFNTPIVFDTVGKVVIVQGLAPVGADITNPGGACLNYIPTTATTALTIDWTRSPVADSVPGGGLRDIALVNNNCNRLAGCGSSATGINCGPANGGCQMSTFFNVLIQGFDNCWQDNNAGIQTWGTDLSNSVIKNCNTGINVTRSEETLVLNNSKIMLNSIGIDLNSAQVGLRISNSNFDSNAKFGVRGGVGCTISFSQTHFENLGVSSSHYVNTGCNVQLSGGDALDDDRNGNTDYWFATNAGMAIRDVALASAGRKVSNLVAVHGIGSMSFINSSPLILAPCPSYAISSICSSIDSSSTPFITSPILNLGGANQSGVLMGGVAPTCAFTAGGGAGSSCDVTAGSGNSFGTVTLFTGARPQPSGAVTLVFNTPLGRNSSSCVWMLSDGRTGQWNARATVIDKKPGTATDIIGWDNNGASLDASTAYQLNYWCSGH